MSETPAVLYGLRCRNPHHPYSGQVYGTGLDWRHLVKLTNDGCSELVVSCDGGVTWEAAPRGGAYLTRASDVTVEPALGPSFREEIHRLRAELEQARAELQRAQPVLDAGRAWWASGENAPEDPTVDALFAAVDTYVSAADRADRADGMAESCQPIGCDNGHHLAGCVYAPADAGEVSGGFGDGDV